MRFGLRDRSNFERKVGSMTYDFSNEIYIPQTAAKLFRDSMEGRQFDDVAAVDGEFQAKHEDELVKQKMKEKYMEDVFTAKMNEHKALFEQMLARTNVNPAQPPPPPPPQPPKPAQPAQPAQPKPGAQAFYIGDRPVAKAPPPKPPPMKAVPKPAKATAANPPKASGPTPPKSPPPDPKRPLRGRMSAMAKGLARSRSPIDRRSKSQPAVPAPQTPELELTRLKRMGAAASSSQPLLSVMPTRDRPKTVRTVFSEAKGPPQKKPKDSARGRPTGAASASKAAAKDPKQTLLDPKYGLATRNIAPGA